MEHDPIYRVTKSYRIIYIIKWQNFDLVLSDIQEIGSQTRKTYKGLESWEMGTLDFFPNQFGRVSDVHTIKGALDKYNIYLSISNSIEDFKLT